MYFMDFVALQELKAWAAEAGSCVCGRMGTACFMTPHHTWVKSADCISSPSVVPLVYLCLRSTAHSSVRATVRYKFQALGASLSPSL